MPNLEVRHISDSGDIEATITVRALTVPEHGGEEWQVAPSVEVTEGPAQFFAALEKVSKKSSQPDEASS